MAVEIITYMSGPN